MPTDQSEQSERLRKARIKAGFKSASSAAENFGWTESAYRHHENGTRGFGLDNAKKYGRAFKVKPGWLLCMDGVDDQHPIDYASDEKLKVIGGVAAGVWREPDATSEVMMEIDLPPPVKSATRFGFVVEGRSMEQHYVPGTVLDCISIFANGVSPENGDHVIVERINPDGLRERTVKEFEKRGDDYYLIPKSNDPQYQEMKIGRPDKDIIDGTEVVVIGFVVSSISPHSLQVLRRLGKVAEL